MLRDKKVYILRDERLRVEVIQLHHDMLVREHRGQWKTIELVTRNFWWPGVIKEVKKYVESYDAYQRNKNHTEALAVVYSDLGWNNLITLLVWVDKENSIEFPFNCCILLIHILVFTFIYKVLHISFKSFSLVYSLIS